MHVIRLKACAVERRCHFHLPVYALFAQYGDFGFQAA